MDVLKYRLVHIILALLLLVGGLLILLYGPKNFGIDMTGGTQSEYTYSGEMQIDTILKDLDKIEKEFNPTHNNVLNDITVYKVSGEEKIVVEVGFNSNVDDVTLDEYQNEFKDIVGKYLLTQNETFQISKYTNIGKSFGDYIKKTAIVTLALALIGITIYVGFAFYGVAEGIPSLSFSVVVLFTQFLDVIVASGLYIIFGMYDAGLKVDTFFITALLTILGFSINNTIVVFDRVRENIKNHLKTKNLYEMINMSIAETTRRSIYTSGTLVFVLLTIFFWGPETLKGFMLVMLFGVVFGVFSSLCVAGSILYELNKNRKLKIYKKKVISDDDKIVV